MKSSGGAKSAKRLRRVLLVDGYNVLHAWSGLYREASQNLAMARERLIDYLQDYQGYSGQEIILVFDSHLSRGNRQHHTKGKLQIVYTRRFETADQYIERVADQLADDPRVQLRVATSDAMEQLVVLGRGATRMSAHELWEELQGLRDDARPYMQVQADKDALELRLDGSLRRALGGIHDKKNKE